MEAKRFGSLSDPVDVVSVYASAENSVENTFIPSEAIKARIVSKKVAISVII